MGLGKTIQTVSFLRQLCTFEATKVRGPFLIVAPLSLIQQWQSEASVWTPDFNAIVYHGSAAARAYLVNHEFYFCEPFVNKAKAQKLKKSNVTKFNIMITTYEVVMKDIEVFSQIRYAANFFNYKTLIFSIILNFFHFNFIQMEGSCGR